jgi:hypothetical protein
MTTFEAFAQRLADRAQRPLFFAELEQLARDRYSDVGPLPKAGDHDAAMAIVLQALPAIQEPFHLGRIVLFAGYLVEYGADPREAALLVAERLAPFMAQAALAAEAPDEQDSMKLARAVAERHPDSASAILAAEPMFAGTMMLLCRERAALRVARQRPSLVADARLVGNKLMVAHFLAELLESSDHQQIVVIHPTRRKGVLVDADGVRNGFHLFTLLQGALIGSDGRGPFGGLPVPEQEVEIARGIAPLEGEREFRARYDYFNWSAWGKDGWLPDGPARWIWGELGLVSIPKVDEHTIVLVDEPKYVRAWDARLACAVHPNQFPDVVVIRELSAEEVARWLARFASAPEAARQAMRYAGVRLE